MIRFSPRFFGKMKQDLYGNYIEIKDYNDNFQLDIEISKLVFKNDQLKCQLEKEKEIRNKMVNLLMSFPNIEKSELIKDICGINKDIDNITIWINHGKIDIRTDKKL